MTSYMEGHQALTCKKCGRGGFYHPREGEDIGTWHRVDKFGNVQAFERPFDAPHWYICPATVQGSEHREKMEEEMGDFQRREFQKREELHLTKKPTLAYGQKMLASEKLTELDRAIAEKVHIMELVLQEIKDLLARKAAD